MQGGYMYENYCEGSSQFQSFSSGMKRLYCQDLDESVEEQSNFVYKSCTYENNKILIDFEEDVALII